METIRIGIIGSGAMAGLRADHFLKEKGCRITAVAARNPETGRVLAHRCNAALHDDWREVTAHPEVDAVFIATHNSLHGEITLNAISHGKAVFCEYPACRSMAEAAALARAVETPQSPPLIYTHRETLSRNQVSLGEAAAGLGTPLSSHFVRVTPHRGRRPEILFNLDLSGPPALFFVYHVYPVVDLFGGWSWVESAAQYCGLRQDKSYDRFTSMLSVQFENHALAQWHWSGGMEVLQPEQSHFYLYEGGSLRDTPSGWVLYSGGKEASLEACEEPGLEEALSGRFLAWVRNPQDRSWKESTRKAIEAARIGIAAELSQNEARRVYRHEVL